MLERLRLVFLCLACLPGGRAAPTPEPVRGITISCQTYGREWGTDGFAEELDELRGLGANWVAIHPYARIQGDGTVSSRLRADDPPDWIVRPIEEAHRHGLKILVKPHLAYWGSPFAWRGDIRFPDPEARARFFRTYRAWILELVRVTADADAFAVGTELDGLTEFEQDWRGLIADVRGITEARLTYAANWSDYQRVPFWDALDAIGVQAYFPLVDESQPWASERELRRGWTRILGPLRELHERSGKPVVFTELGYCVSPEAALRPWVSRRGEDGESDPARELQRRCFDVALRVLDGEREWLRGAFLWKWFVGAAPGENFVLDTPTVRAVLQDVWAAAERR